MRLHAERIEQNHFPNDEDSAGRQMSYSNKVFHSIERKMLGNDDDDDDDDAAAHDVAASVKFNEIHI